MNNNELQQVREALESAITIRNVFIGSPGGEDIFKNAIAIVDQMMAELDNAETSAEMPCVEEDGCPTELVVLKRYWRSKELTAAAKP